MSLRFDITNCDRELLEEKYPDVPATPTSNLKWNPITYCLMFATMSVGINEITEANWREFYLRLHMVELGLGKTLLVNGEPTHLKPEHVKDHIGLSTNASEMSKQQFKNLLCDNMRRSSEYQLDKLERELANSEA